MNRTPVYSRIGYGTAQRLVFLPEQLAQAYQVNWRASYCLRPYNTA
jgi:hypothetical protein